LSSATPLELIVEQQKDLHYDLMMLISRLDTYSESDGILAVQIVRAACAEYEFPKERKPAGSGN
jgi:hypothetical protein